MQQLARLKWWGALALALAMAAAGAAPSHANDSSAELSLGGLVFTKTADVSMESEDLAITPETVTVRYRFLNRTSAPVTLTVAFPLPDIDLSDADNVSIPVGTSPNFVGFETKVDGKPVEFKIVQRALLGDKDVSAQLRELRLPFLPLGELQNKLNDLPDAARTKLIDGGLLIQSGSTERGKPIYSAGWKVRTSVVRQQTFPSNLPVSVEHRYRTSVGASVDTILRQATRKNTGMAAELERYRKDYCVSDAFLAEVDKLAGSGDANTAKVQERRISYVLKTGANWAGPIKQFHLTVDSGKPGHLVSFCGADIKATSPTAYEVNAKNFTPTRDLKILIVGKFE